jgi:hypothetical protein
MVESTQPDAQLVERLRQHVDVLAELIGPRHVGKPQAPAAAAGYIERQFLALDDPVERQTYDAEGTAVANLIVERRGERHPDSIVVLGAHYDTVPITPGADDSASAVAVLICRFRRKREPVFRRRGSQSDGCGASRGAGGGGGKSPRNGDSEDPAEIDGSGGKQELMGGGPQVELIATGTACEAAVEVPLEIHGEVGDESGRAVR